ncbi:MAG: methyltransferase domain-containing protein [Rhodoferax sp.]|nr:methyltransferase domain-containing protein [Rhodoferax sp.]
MTLDLEPFKALIRVRCGLTIEGNNEDKLAQALLGRIRLLNSEHSPAGHSNQSLPASDYYRRLSQDAAEFQSLVNLLTINETYFFREPEQIRLLVHRLAPRVLAAQSGNTPVRILSAGCSSGEEPYSLVMALMEKYGETVSRLFSFTGGDIDSEVLHKARAASYTEFSFRGVATDLRERYFDKARGVYVLKEEIRNQVQFHELNLLTCQTGGPWQNFDIIFFRNVSIYFDPPTRALIQRKLADLLKPDGVLVIGTAETLANDLGVLPLVEEDGLFYFVKVKGQPPLAPALVRPSLPLAPNQTFYPLPIAPLADPSAAIFSSHPPARQSLVPNPATPLATASSCPPVDTELAHARELVLDKHYDLALPLLNNTLAAEPGHRQALLLKAFVLLNRKQFESAHQAADQVFQTDHWSIDALLLLGLAARWRNLNEAAIPWFRQAVYAHHGCWPAHFYLAELYRHQDEPELAQRAYRTVLGLLSRDASDTGIRTIPQELVAGEIRFLCEHQRSRLAQTATPTGAR